jgi:hypothetical protein
LQGASTGYLVSPKGNIGLNVHPGPSENHRLFYYIELLSVLLKNVIIMIKSATFQVIEIFYQFTPTIEHHQKMADPYIAPPGRFHPLSVLAGSLLAQIVANFSLYSLNLPAGQDRF